MLITAFFTDGGTPKTGLSPTLTVLDASGSSIVTAQAMTEIGSGFYKYDFSSYDEDEDYVMVADGTATLTSAYDRYVSASNETGGVGRTLQISKGRWKILNNQMLFYDTDGSTVLYTFDLKNKNGAVSSKDVFERSPA